MHKVSVGRSCHSRSTTPVVHPPKKKSTLGRRLTDFNQFPGGHLSGDHYAAAWSNKMEFQTVKPHQVRLLQICCRNRNLIFLFKKPPASFFHPFLVSVPWYRESPYCIRSRRCFELPWIVTHLSAPNWPISRWTGVDLLEKIVHKSAQNHTYRTHLERLYKPDVVRDQEGRGFKSRHSDQNGMTLPNLSKEMSMFRIGRAV